MKEENTYSENHIIANESYRSFWFKLHAGAILFFLLFGCAKLFAFGYGIELNPPVDIHVPGSEELYDMIEEENHQYEIVWTDENGNTIDA